MPISPAASSDPSSAQIRTVPETAAPTVLGDDVVVSNLSERQKFPSYGLFGGESGTLGITLITQAFRMAPAAVVAPFDYTALLWAGVLGWLVWGDLPDGLTLAGAAVIVVSGLWLVVREHRGAAVSEET